ncbi:hypothetical protein ACLVWU_03185 [Bdellovibrio sp. HCB290]|uniref:hypothetical protein n=1 Tax=Bdellovibrio sp. HCB290 TaxID=3394356 RepID=UPI0039B64FEE
MRFYFLCSILVLLVASAEAKVLDITRDSMAPYFTLSGGPSSLSSNGYAGEATGTSVSGESKYTYGGEFGFLLSRKFVNVAFGIGIIKPSMVEGFSGTDTGGTQLFTGDSEVLAFAPRITVEFNLQGDPVSRSFISLGVGYADVKLSNSYTLTAAGSAAYPGAATAIESKGSATELTAGLGYEGILSDSTTYVFQFGYRQLRVDHLKYTKDYSTFNGPVTAGETVMNGASNRELNLSGGFLSLGFRFYL